MKNLISTIFSDFITKKSLARLPPQGEGDAKRKLFLFFLLMAANSSFAIPTSDPCATGVLALLNRPSITGSACVIPKQKIMIEGGYQYFNLPGGAQGYSTPQAEIRFGLPGENELLIAAPTFFHETKIPRAGWSAPIVSLKHELGYNTHWLGAVEGLVTIPSGSEHYGSKAWAGAVNGIATYTFNPALSITGTLGVMSQSVQYIKNGQRFKSINPDVIATWQFDSQWMVFGELYAQTRTGPGEGLGLLTDAGFYYLLTPRVSLDAELGQRITGQWGFISYAGAGIGILFG